jgi:hypothetical protein
MSDSPSAGIGTFHVADGVMEKKQEPISVEELKRQERELQRTRTDKLLREDDALMSCIYDKDDFRSIIIGQTFIETVIAQMIDLRCVHPIDRWMSFDMKLSLAYALGVIDVSWIPTLKRLADMRNAFAHKLGHSDFDKARVRELREDMKALEYDIFYAFMSPKIYAALYDRQDDFDQQLFQKLSFDDDRSLVRSCIFMVFLYLFNTYEHLRRANSSLPSS